MSQREDIKEGSFIVPERGGTVHVVRHVLLDRAGNVYGYACTSTTEVLMKAGNVRKYIPPKKFKAV